MDIIALLKAERDKVAQQLSGLNAALAAFAKAKGQKVIPIKAGKRRISPAGLARIRAANRARWAKVRAAKMQGIFL
jgi:hypothetical protein